MLILRPGLCVGLSLDRRWARDQGGPEEGLWLVEEVTGTGSQFVMPSEGDGSKTQNILGMSRKCVDPGKASLPSKAAITLLTMFVFPLHYYSFVFFLIIFNCDKMHKT